DSAAQSAGPNAIPTRAGWRFCIRRRTGCARIAAKPAVDFMAPAQGIRLLNKINDLYDTT
ncbi:TPA: hypothetical protein ACHP5V_006599, partial [Pseudomonas aeruginosa]